MTTNRSNAADKPVRLIAVYADGHVSHRDLSRGRAPWNSGAAWGRAGAHALPNEGPGDMPPAPPVKREKDPRKVAAGKARAAQAAASGVKGKFVKAQPMQSVAKTLTSVPPQPARKRAKAGEPKVANPDAMVVCSFRCTRAQKAKFDKLGAGEWARARIDAAQRK